MVALSGMLKAQPTIPVKIVYISPEDVCPGDSVSFCFILTQPVPPDSEFKVIIYFKDSGDPPALPVQVFSGHLSDLNYSDTLNTDTVYCVKIQIPYTLSIGQWCASGNAQSAQIFCIWIKECAVGIKELDASVKCGTMIYYNLFGEVINPEPNKLMIRRVGSEFKKVILIE